MENAAKELKRVEKLAKPQVAYERNDNYSPHHKSGMPRLWRIAIVVEDGKADDTVCNGCRKSRAVDDPRTDSQPA